MAPTVSRLCYSVSGYFSSIKACAECQQWQCLAVWRDPHGEFRASIFLFFCSALVVCVKSFCPSSSRRAPIGIFLRRPTQSLTRGEANTVSEHTVSGGERTEWEGSWKVSTKKLRVEVITQRGVEFEYDREKKKGGQWQERGGREII